MLRRLFGSSRRKTSRSSTKYFRPQLEGLEDRWAPAVLDWSPTMGNNWNVPQNWLPGRNQFPQGADFARFGPNNNQQPITVTQSVTCGGVKFGDGTNAYTGQMTLNANVVLDTGDGFTLNQNPVAQSKIAFNTGSKLVAESGNSIFTNFTFTGARGTVWIKGPSQPAPQGASLTVLSNAASDTRSDFLIGGTLTMANSAPVTFKGGAGITIAAGQQVNGSMTIQAMNNTILDDNHDGGIIENSGVVTYTGVAGTSTQATMAFLNHKTATFNTGDFVFAASSNATNGYSMKMDGGSLTLAGGITFTLLNDYYQTGGTLQTPDATTENLDVANKAEIDGGKINLNTGGGANPFGSLNIPHANLNFNGGEYDAKINGAAGGSNDEITVAGKITIAGNSTLKVSTLNGKPAAGLHWDILIALGGGIGNAFANQTFDQTNEGAPDPNRLQMGDYTVFSNNN